MHSIKKQQGMGLLNLIGIIVLGAFIGKFLFTVVPMYTENRYVVAGLKDLATTGKKLQDMSDMEIRKKMEDFYMINNVTREGSRKFVIVRNANGVVVKNDYEARDVFFGDIDLVWTFNNHLHSTHPDLCCTPTAEPASAK